MLYKKLYKLNTNGSTQVWSIFIDGGEYWTETSKLDGKVIVNAKIQVTPKVKRTLEEQVLLEVNAKVKKKVAKKYVENLKDIHSADSALPGYTAMLAHRFDKHGHKMEFPCYAQPKLDGVRCLATKEGMFSRTRKQFSSCPHIQEELDRFFFFYPEAQLDGELYTHAFKNDFEKIVSSVRKTADKATPEDLERQKSMEYWVYDCPRFGREGIEGTFAERSFSLESMLRQKGFKYIKFVPTIKAEDKEHLYALKEAWVSQGFEGAMARNMNSPYEGKRSYNLLKIKDFLDNEYTIIGIYEGQGKLYGHAGGFVFQLDSRDKTFKAKLVGSFSRLKKIWVDPSLVIGKKGTVRYQNLTADGIPRFGVCVGVRDYE